VGKKHAGPASFDPPAHGLKHIGGETVGRLPARTQAGEPKEEIEMEWEVGILESCILSVELGSFLEFFIIE